MISHDYPMSTIFLAILNAAYNGNIVPDYRQNLRNIKLITK